MTRNQSIAVAAIVVPLLVVAATYAVLVPALYSQMTVSDNIPTGASYLSSIEFFVGNNAPITVPYASPSYDFGVTVDSNTSSVTCTLSTIKGALPCSGNSVALGKIPPGQSASVYVSIQATGNFTLRAYVVMDYFGQKTVATKTISCTLVHGYAVPQFTCSES